MNKAINTAIIGCGGFIKGQHLQHLHRNPNFNLHAVCDLNEDILNEIREPYNLKYTTTDFNKICSDPEIEAIIIGTNPYFRLPIMKAAVKNNKHLFVEKPMSLDPDDTKEMYQLIKNTDIKFQVGYNRPYSQIMQETKSLYHKARDINNKGHNNTLITYRIIGEAQIWPEHHRKSVYEGSSTLIHETTHIFDLLNWLTDMEPTHLYSAGGNIMDNIVTLHYSNNTTAVIIAGDNGTVGYPKESLEINTNHSVIAARNFVELYYAGSDIGQGRKYFEYTVGGKPRKQKSYQEFEDQLWKYRTTFTPEDLVFEHGVKNDSTIGLNKGHYEELQAFYECIVQNKPTACDERKGALATLIALEAIKSTTTKKAVDLDFSFLDS